MTQQSQLKPVIQIVPRFFPTLDGVGDYALNLARQLRQDIGIETSFVVCDPTWTGATEVEGFPIAHVPVQSAKYLLAQLLAAADRENNTLTPVLLHYVNYGYAKRGCPFWLLDALEYWKKKATGSSLVTMFHEVYAYGFPPWASSFWLSPIQRNLASRLARVSDRCLTSRRSYAELVYDLSQGKQSQIPTLPVFSTVGESEQVLPLAQRSPKIVVFGACGSRTKVYQNSSTELGHACKLLKIEEIIDIGSPTQLSLSAIAGVPVIEMGQLPPPKVSEILSHSLAGFFDYIPGYLAKSTIFAAYCAHGLLPISDRYNPSDSDGIELGKHYWVPEEPATGLEELQAIADNAHAWYQDHQLSVQCQIFAEQLSLKD
jgi:hypothetical protein